MVISYLFRSIGHDLTIQPIIYQLTTKYIISMSQHNHQEAGISPVEFKHVKKDLDLMRNRVNLLRSQLQKEKDSISKHKSMTEDMIRKKVEISKITSLKNKDVAAISQDIQQLRERNHSYRQIHKKQMNNILKAVYLVKLDEARQLKSLSQQNRSVLEERERSMKEKQREKQRDLAIQSEKAKQRYIDYWKQKLNSVYSAGQKDQMELEMEAEQRKKQLKQLQQEEISLLQQINHAHNIENDAKKEYLAALTLSSREVVAAVKNKTEEEPKRQKIITKEQYRERQWEEKVEKMQGSKEKRFKDKKQRQEQFWSKSPHVSIMSSHDLSTPRANVDQSKLKIILKELKRLQALDKK